MILKKADGYGAMLEFGPDYWSDYGHQHLDWDGIGNFNREIRSMTLQAHATVFRAYARRLSALAIPFQLFISLVIEDGGQDAVYLHTPNPQSAFPVDFDDVEWGVPKLEEHLSEVLPEFRFVAGRRDFNYIVWAKGVGVPLC